MIDNQAREREPAGIDPTFEQEPELFAEPLQENVHRALDRLETLLKKIHGTLDSRSREGEHRDWPYVRMTAVILQVIVAGLIVLALFDWILYGPVNTLIVKLAFAGVLQVSALTAFLISRKEA